MQITIASLSSAVLDCLSIPGSFGEIHSVFDRVVNIKLNNAQRIVAFTFSQAGGLPYAFMLADGQLESFIKAGVVTGQAVDLVNDRRMRIKGTEIIFDFHEAITWSPGMKNLTDPDDDTGFLELLSWSADYVFKHSNQAGLVPLLENHQLLFDGKPLPEDAPHLRVASLATPAIAALLKALRQGDEKVVTNSTIHLLGYGIGGTPSGDDLLVGMLAALKRSNRSSANQYSVLLSNAIKENLTDQVTSLLSQTVLQHALEGEFSEKIHEVTHQLMHPDNADSITSSLDRLLLHGATSGSEMFLGLCLGYQLVYGQGPRI